MTPQFAARWLRLVAVALLVFMAVWATAALPGFDRPATLLMDLNDWPLDGSHDILSRDTRWLSAIGAGLLAALALLLALVVAPALEAGQRYVRQGALTAIVAWYVIDSVGSVTAGVPENVLVNTVYLALMAVPLWRVDFDSNPVVTR